MAAWIKAPLRREAPALRYPAPRCVQCGARSLGSEHSTRTRTPRLARLAPPLNRPRATRRGTSARCHRMSPRMARDASVRCARHPPNSSARARAGSSDDRSDNTHASDRRGFDDRPRSYLMSRAPTQHAAQTSRGGANFSLGLYLTCSDPRRCRATRSRRVYDSRGFLGFWLLGGLTCCCYSRGGVEIKDVRCVDTTAFGRGRHNSEVMPDASVES